MGSAGSNDQVEEKELGVSTVVGCRLKKSSKFKVQGFGYQLSVVSCRFDLARSSDLRPLSTINIKTIGGNLLFKSANSAGKFRG